MLNTGSTGFMLLATSLVMLMTPGLAFFYGGLASKRNILGIMMQSFVSLGIDNYFMVFYWLFSVLQRRRRCNHRKPGQNVLAWDYSDYYVWKRGFPELVFVAYQMMFAIITPALITGAFANRITFKAYIIFLIVWQLFVYYPFVHMVWGGGLLAKMGVLDFAGGIVVHATAGFAALASVFFVGSRKYKDSKPNNIPLMAIGTALLWFGWYGFNAGSELNVDGITALAFLNTDIAASFAAITWMVIEWFKESKPKFVGLMTGAVAGLATVTPAAGFVSLPVAALMGILGAVVCYFAVHIKNKMEWDDALDVWGVHGIGGVTGTILLGVFASTAINPAGADGLLYGGTGFFIKELVVVAGASIYAFVFTYIMLIFINVITPVKVSDEEQLIGLDISLHGESAYDSIHH